MYAGDVMIVYMADNTTSAGRMEDLGINPDLEPAVEAALEASNEYTTMSVSKLDLKFMNTAKEHVGRDGDSHRDFLNWLLSTHPALDNEQLEHDAIKAFDPDTEA